MEKNPFESPIEVGEMTAVNANLSIGEGDAGVLTQKTGKIS